MQSALRRHQSRQRGTGIRRIDSSEDVRWLGFDWGDRLYFASDYFEQLYEWAVQLIEDGKAYVCDLSADEVRDHRGTLTEPGREQPLPQSQRGRRTWICFERMRAGEFPDGARTLRAKIDMALAQPESARSGDVPHPARSPSSHGRRLVHLSHVRLHPRAVATRSNASRTRSARWNSKTIDRCTTGIIRQLGIYHPAADRIRPTEPDVHRDEQAASCCSWCRRKAGRRLGRSAHADHLGDCAAEATRPKRFALFCDRIGVAKFNSTIEMHCPGKLRSART